MMAALIGVALLVTRLLFVWCEWLPDNDPE